jgi:hypothetical protein
VATAYDSEVDLVGPPAGLTAVAVGFVVVALLLFLPKTLVAHVLGYVFSTLLAISAVTAYRWIDQRRRSNRYYAGKPSLGRINAITLAVALVVAAGHTWAVATYLAAS